MADFRQFYAMDLPIEGDADIDDLPRMAMLWAALPRESRTARRLDPDLMWSDAEHLLHSIEYSCRLLAYSRTRDAERGRNRPVPLETPSERIRARAKASAALANRADIDRILGMG